MMKSKIEHKIIKLSRKNAMKLKEFAKNDDI